MTNSMSLSQIPSGGIDVPVSEVEPSQPSFIAEEGALRYRAKLSDVADLDALLVNKGADTLVVSLHGALQRKHYQLPRFERLATLLEEPVNSMFFSDPSLCLNSRLELAWFTGWEGLNLHELMARWISEAASSIGASRIVISGSSGGGFAALQTATYIPDSLALVFNPQTRLDNYYVKGDPQRTSAQADYLKTVYPQLCGKIDGLPCAWGEKVGDKASAQTVYSKPVANRVHYWTSKNDFHHEQHYLPFIAACKDGKNLPRVKTFEYVDRPGHRPPNQEVFRRALSSATS